MKKALSIILLSVLVLSVFAFPISAAAENGEVGASVVEAANASGNVVTLDGVKNSEAEGYSDTPTAYLNQTYFGTNDNPATGTHATVDRGEVYMSYDENYVYLFVIVYANSNNIFDSAQTQTFIKVNFGDVGEEEAYFWGTNKNNIRNNPKAVNDNWTTTEEKTLMAGYAKNNNDDGSYTAELKLPIPESLKETLLASGLNVRIAVTQGLQAKDTTPYWGAYIGAEPKEGVNEQAARDAVANGIAVKLPAILDQSEELLKESLKQWLADSKTNADHAYLTGLSVNLFGDSYFTGGDLNSEFTWASMLASKYGWTLNNYGVNGNMVSTFDDIDPSPMVNRYRTLANNDPDLVIVTGGYNDWKNGVPLGESGSTDKDTYIGALNTMLKGLKSKYKDSAIVFVTPWNFTGTNSLSLTYQDYVNAMVAACEANGVYCFKGYDSTVSGIDMQDEAFRTQYCVSVGDSYHLNLEGMKLVFPKAETALNEAVTQWLEGDDTAGAGDSDNDNTQSGNTGGSDATNGDTGTADSGTGTTAPDASAEEEDEGGCGSSVAAAPILIASVAALAAAAIPRKRKE